MRLETIQNKLASLAYGKDATPRLISLENEKEQTRLNDIKKLIDENRRMTSLIWYKLTN